MFNLYDFFLCLGLISSGVGVLLCGIMCFVVFSNDTAYLDNILPESMVSYPDREEGFDKC